MVECREFIAYRDLIWQLVRRDFTARFKQTALGPIWYIFTPLLTTVVFAAIFGRVLSTAPDNIPPLLFYNAGLLAWNFFAGVIGATGNTLQGNVHLFSKVYFPRLVVPVAQVFSNLIALAVQFIAFGILVIYVGTTDSTFRNIEFSLNILWIPLLLTHIAVLALGCGLILSALTAKYRDLQNILGFVINSLMFITPVMWPLATLQSKFPENAPFFVMINPMVSVVEGFRLALIGVGTFSPALYIISAISSTVLLFVGILLFQSSARSFVDQA